MLFSVWALRTRGLSIEYSLWWPGMLLFPGYAPTVLCSMPAAATKLHGLGFEAQADMLIGCLPISLLPL